MDLKKSEGKELSATKPAETHLRVGSLSLNGLAERRPSFDFGRYKDLFFKSNFAEFPKFAERQFSLREPFKK